MLELSQNWENFEKLSKLKITSSFSLEHTDFENALFEKIHRAPFEDAKVAKVKWHRNSKWWKCYMKTHLK